MGASGVVDGGLTLRVVQGLFGHALTSTTEVYLRPAALEDLKRAVDRDYRAVDIEARTAVGANRRGDG